MSYIANIFGYVLNAIYGLVNNYGFAIIIFTILLKLIMLPISIKQQKTMKKSAEMQAKVKDIQTKYANDQVRQSQEMMDLYKREKVSPFAGCLSSIIQMVLVLSMFYLVSRPLTFMLHVDNDIISNYTQQIEEERGERINYSEIAIIKEKASQDDNVNINMNFLGLDLSEIPSQNYTDIKVFIIPALYVVTSIISSKMTMKMNKVSKTKDEKSSLGDDPNKKALIKNENNDLNKEADAMEEMNKQMSLMMPIMSVSIALIAPLGLALYWLVSNLLSLFERIIINALDKKEDNLDGKK